VHFSSLACLLHDTYTLCFTALYRWS
jgi:hypothetical protein